MGSSKPKSVPLERATCEGISKGTAYRVEAALYDIGFACVIEIAIEGREVIKHPVQLPRRETLEQALDQGRDFAVGEIERMADAGARASNEDIHARPEAQTA